MSPWKLVAKRRGIWWVVGALILLVLLMVALVLMGIDHWMRLSDIKEEFFKTTMQLGSATLAVGVASTLYGLWREAHDARADILERLGRAHGDVYVARRKLRLAAKHEGQLPEAVDLLLDARVQLGDTNHRLRASRSPEAVHEQIRVMRDYLEECVNRLIEDREKGAKHTQKRYESDFKGPYLAAKYLIARDWNIPTEQWEIVSARLEGPLGHEKWKQLDDEYRRSKAAEQASQAKSSEAE